MRLGRLRIRLFDCRSFVVWLVTLMVAATCLGQFHDDFVDVPTARFGSEDRCSFSSGSLERNSIVVVILGAAQDGGFPQAGCQKKCCRRVWEKPELRQFVSSIAVVDTGARQRWLFDCTPDFRDQLQLLDSKYPVNDKVGLTGIFLTHAHMGHYTGLMHLGREAIGAKQVPVYAMPRMGQFLTKNGPWSQLVKLKNIQLHGLKADQVVKLSSRIRVTPIQVPHRDEFSETVGYKMKPITNLCCIYQILINGRVGTVLSKK